MMSSYFSWLSAAVFVISLGLCALAVYWWRSAGILMQKNSVEKLSISSLKSGSGTPAEEIQQELIAAAAIAAAARRMERITNRAESKLLIVLCLGAAVGYGGRDLQAHYSTHTLTNLTVLRRTAPDWYRIANAEKQVSDMHICPPVPDIPAGALIQVMVLEDEGHCKRISGRDVGFLILRGPDHKPILQNIGGLE